MLGIVLLEALLLAGATTTANPTPASSVTIPVPPALSNGRPAVPPDDVGGGFIQIDNATKPAAATTAPAAPVTGTTTIMSLVRMSANSCPPGTPLFFCFYSMPTVDAGPTAYYRDVFAGMTVWLEPNPAVQTEYYMKSEGPTGFTRSTAAVTYYPTFSGQSRCFVGGGFFHCGSSVAGYLFYDGVQCAPPGAWKVTMYENQQETTSSGTFHLAARIPDDSYKSFSQFYQDWRFRKYDHSCHWPGAPDDGKDYDVYLPPGKQCSDPEVVIEILKRVSSPAIAGEYRESWIGAKGCALTAYVDMLTYYGVPGVTPRTLNDYLSAKPRNEGFFDVGRVNPSAVARYARANGVFLEYLGQYEAKQYKSPGEGGMGLLCRYGPGLVQTNSHHWQMVAGFTADDERTLKTANPARDSGLPDDPNYPGSRSGLIDTYPAWFPRVGDLGFADAATHNFGGVTQAVNSGSFFVIFRSPVHFIVTDPQGRRTGYDVASGHYIREIPGAMYDDGPGGGGPDRTEPPAQDAHFPKAFGIPQATAGEYAIAVTGTHDGTYSMDVLSYDTTDKATSLPSVEDQPIQMGEKVRYTLSYDPTPGVATERYGGFDGGGQRPRDVNRFLTYVKPTAGTTSLPTGTTEYRVTVSYGATVLPAAFTANLNGTSVGNLFHPAPGTQEIVALPLTPGSNVLKLSIDGLAGRRTATDSDRLVFDVQ